MLTGDNISLLDCYNMEKKPRNRVDKYKSLKKKKRKGFKGVSYHELKKTEASSSCIFATSVDSEDIYGDDDQNSTTSHSCFRHQ